MTKRQTYALVLGRASARVARGWTQGAYSRHNDGRPLQTFGIRADTVDVVGALAHAAHEYELSDADFELLRYLVTWHLPAPYCMDVDFGIERWNDAVTTGAEDALNLLRDTQEDYEWLNVVHAFAPAMIAA